ncbi:MAG TPA: cytochrome c oxidase subunit 4 [Anaerolineales bacterium]|nr:cytochrome c oxidase subunit 4 [Anaerolineales bacterium]
MKEKPEIHLPDPSYWPIALAFSMVLISIGVVSSFIVSIVGVIGLLVSIAGWTLENRSDEQEHHHE